MAIHYGPKMKFHGTNACELSLAVATDSSHQIRIFATVLDFEGIRLIVLMKPVHKLK